MNLRDLYITTLELAAAFQDTIDEKGGTIMDYSYDPKKVYQGGELYKYARSFSDGSTAWDVIRVTKKNKNHVPIGTFTDEAMADELIAYEIEKRG